MHHSCLHLTGVVLLKHLRGCPSQEALNDAFYCPTDTEDSNIAVTVVRLGISSQGLSVTYFSSADCHPCCRLQQDSKVTVNSIFGQ